MRDESVTNVDDVRWYLGHDLRDRVTDEQIERVIARLPGRPPMYVAHAIRAGMERIDRGR